MPPVPDVLTSAFRLHQSGLLAEAEQAYLWVLDVEPNHADAWHLLGIVAAQLERYRDAEERIARAISLYPAAASFHFDMGNVLAFQGRYEDASASFRRAVELDPDCVDAHASWVHTTVNAMLLSPGPPDLPVGPPAPYTATAAGSGVEPGSAAFDLVIVVPYRDRLEHLRQFAPHMERFLAGRQRFKIAVIEQTPGGSFNYGKLRNIGFALNRDAADVFCFHDVDTLPQDEHCDYTVAERPVHLAGRVTKYGCRPMYAGFTGAVMLLRRADFEAVNGYSNQYWGYGREDDDFGRRLWAAGLRWEKRPGYYLSLDHPCDELQPRNDARFLALVRGEYDWRKEGLNSLEFRAVRELPLATFLDMPDVGPQHTVTTVDVGMPLEPYSVDASSGVSRNPCAKDVTAAANRVRCG